MLGMSTVLQTMLALPSSERIAAFRYLSIAQIGMLQDDLRAAQNSLFGPAPAQSQHQAPHQETQPSSNADWDATPGAFTPSERLAQHCVWHPLRKKLEGSVRLALSLTQSLCTVTREL